MQQLLQSLRPFALLPGNESGKHQADALDESRAMLQNQPATKLSGGAKHRYIGLRVPNQGSGPGRVELRYGVGGEAMPTIPVLSRRRFLAYSTLSAASLAASLPFRALAAATESTEQTSMPVATVSASPAQTMHGFGASGAWWPNDLYRFEPAVRESVADMLFDPSGIGLSVYRYNLGSGGVGVTNPVRAPETFLVAPGVYDWSRDLGGRLFLRLAAERGVPILIGFVNSAPAAWTTNGASCGGELRPELEAAYAAYLADVVVHFHDVDGITLSFLSPVNEPDNPFDNCGQEGMRMPVEQRAQVFQALGRELAVRAPYCRVIADESSRAGEQFMRDASRWLDVPGTADSLAALALHRYDFPNDVILRLARELSEDYGKPLWSTEICCIDTRTGTWGRQYDPTIKGALMMANVMYQGMTVANDAAFHWWVALSSEIGADPIADPSAASQPNGEGWNDGLLYYDPNYAENDNQQIYPTKRYHAMGNFSRYVRPGARRHDVIGAPRHLQILAFATDAADAPVVPPSQLPSSQVPWRGNARSPSWSIVIINNDRPGSDSTPVRLQLPPVASAGLTPIVAVETSAERDLAPVALPAVSPTGLLSADAPAQSITTFVLGGSGR
jgi:O-glycosyl hydrolase